MFSNSDSEPLGSTMTLDTPPGEYPQTHIQILEFISLTLQYSEDFKTDFFVVGEAQVARPYLT